MANHDSTAASTEPRRRPGNELQNRLLATEGVEGFLQWLVTIAVTTIGGDICAAVTLARDGRPVTLASSDQDAAQYGEMQYTRNEGPCLTAMHTGKVVLIEDLDRDERYNQYRPRALALGVRSSLSMPVDGEGHTLGALTLYSRHAHAFGPAEQLEAERFADEVSRALHLAVRRAGHVEIPEQRRTAPTSRTVIDRAIGIVMGQNRCDADTALGFLHATSQDRNVKLRVLAAEIITAVNNRARFIGEHVHLLGSLDTDPPLRSATRMTSPRPTMPTPPELEPTALKSTCWCNFRGGV